MKYYTYLALFAFILVLNACSKHKGDVEENIPVATIQFHNPTSNGVYHIGDSIAIEATAISSETIHGYDVSVRKAGDTTRYFFEHVHDHNDTLSISSKWKAELESAATLETEITLVLDHEGHTKTQKVTFQVQ